MCDPTRCADISEGSGLDPTYLMCVENANSLPALICACTQLMWECLRDEKRGNCKIADSDHPVDEAGSWCRKFVAKQKAGCNPILCGPPRPPPDVIPSFGVVVFITFVIGSSMFYIALSYHSSTAAGRQLSRRL
eukprot:TRINITY_DN38946_c0_g1_i1.p1 TRINITY_DN38946_c0_g1~~TRINITY_DN38946_c0_g1_i1.p1  ORF type:complete len:134 (+),score=15.60 TRINITY_DN38946_c0_g1_i1:35-436(+)